MKRSRWLELAPGLTYGALGGLLLASSSIGPEQLAPLARGDFSSEFVDEFPNRARWIGLALLAVSALVAYAAPSLCAYAAQAAAGWPAFRTQLYRAVRYGLAPRNATEWFALAAIGSSAVALRLAYLWQPIRNDEAITIYEFASRPLHIALAYYPAPNNHMFHTLLVHGLQGLLGDDVWAIRIPALAAGLLLVPCTLLTAQVLYGRAAAWLAAALVATSSILIEYSTNARGYSLVTLFFVAGLGLVGYVARTRSAAGTLALAGVLALGFWTTPTMLYAAAVLLTLLVLAWWRREPTNVGQAARSLIAPSLLVIGCLTLLVYLPAALVSGAERIVANPWVRPLAVEALPAALSSMLTETWRDWQRDIPWPLTGILTLGLVAAQVWRGALGVSVLAAVLVACVPIVLAQRVAPFERVWLFLLPAFFIEGSAGLIALATARTRTLAPAVAGAAGLVLGWNVFASGSVLTSDETGVFVEAEPITRELAGVVGPDDSVLTCVRASLPELQYYFRRYALDPQALIRPTSSGSVAYIVVREDLSECTAGVLGARPIAWDQWEDPRVFGEFGSARVLELRRHDVGTLMR